MTAIPSWVRVGAKVVCVNSEQDPGHDPAPNMPKKNEVCIIAGVSSSFYSPGQVTLVIEGHSNCCPIAERDVGFFLWRFRPLISQADDIAEHFQQFLHTPQKIEERA